MIQISEQELEKQFCYCKKNIIIIYSFSNVAYLSLGGILIEDEREKGWASIS